MTIPNEDPVRAFVTALPYHVRQKTTLDHRTIRCIRAACQRLTPAELARIVATGISRRTPANPAQVIRYRLAREARLENDDQEVMP